MTDHPIRRFADDAAIVRVGEGLLDRTLPRAEWTHEAHLAATVWLLHMHPALDLDREIAGIIRGYNEAVGGVNDDHQGYHDTITRTCLAGVRAFLVGRDPHETIADTVNALLVSPAGQRDWPLRFYTRDRLFSVAARGSFVTPDIAALDGSGES